MWLHIAAHVTCQVPGRHLPMRIYFTVFRVLPWRIRFLGLGDSSDAVSILIQTLFAVSHYFY